MVNNTNTDATEYQDTKKKKLVLGKFLRKFKFHQNSVFDWILDTKQKFLLKLKDEMYKYKKNVVYITIWH